MLLGIIIININSKHIFFQELPVRVNANGHVYGQVDLDDDSDKSNSNYQRPYGVARRPSVLLSPDYTGKCVKGSMRCMVHLSIKMRINSIRNTHYPVVERRE